MNGGSEEIGRADLPAFEDNLDAAGGRTRSLREAKRRAGGKRGKHLQGLDAQRPAGETRGVAAGDHDAPHSSLGEGLAGKATEPGATLPAGTGASLCPRLV